MSHRALNNLLFRLHEAGLEEKLAQLLYVFRDELPEESRAGINSIQDLFNELKDCRVIHIDDLTPLKEALGFVGRQDLVENVEELERQRAEQTGALQRYGASLQSNVIRFSRGKSARILFSSAKWAGEKMLGAINLHCNFRTIGGGVVVAGAVLILRRCTTLEELVTAFKGAVLPAANTLCAISDGSVCFTVQAENLSALQVLWQQYHDGTLQKNLQDFLITDEIKLLADGQEVIVNVNIVEQEYNEACLDLMITETKALQKEPFSQRPRRSSDSLLHCPSRKAEEERWKLRKSELPESGVKEKHNFGDQAEHMDPGRLTHVQRYVEKLQDTHSVTSETTDSGLGTNSAPSVLGAEEYSDICKDLSKQVIRDISGRLGMDKVAWRNVCVALQLTGLEGREPVTLEKVISFFPATPVRLLQDVFNALDLYDLVELLEKEVKFNNSSLRLQRTLQEVRTLRKSAERPTTYHSNVAVLIVYHADVHAENMERIKKVFMDLNSDNDVTIIRGLPREVRERRKEDLKSLGKESDKTLKQLMRLKKLSDDVKLGALNRQRMSLENGLSEIESAEKVALETVERWIQNQGRFTFCAVFDFVGFLSGSEYTFMKEKLEILSDKDKLVLTPVAQSRTFEKLPETLLVTIPRYVLFLPNVHDAVGKIFNNRWQTLDLCSMMEELRRTIQEEVQIRDNMSSSVRLKKLEDKDSA